MLLHREAFNGVMYESQTWSKRDRTMLKQLDSHFKSEKAFETLYSKNFKKTYRGKPTKRYTRLMKIINESDELSTKEIFKMIGM